MSPVPPTRFAEPVGAGGRRRGSAAVILLSAVIPATGWLMAMPIPGAGQAEIAVELGASRIGPALGVMADDSHFGMAGLRGSLHTASGTGIVGSVLAGTALGATDGHFVSGLLEGRVVDRWSPNLEARLEGRLMGFGAATPFPYRSNAIEGGPSLRWWGPDVSLEVTGLAGIGLSRIELWRVQDGPTRVFEQELRRAGGTAELLLGPPTSQFGLVGGWHHTPKGDYRSVGARAVFAGPWGVVELRADRWITPLDAEVVAGLALVIPIGSAWSVRGFFGRTEPDPLTLAQPGEASGGMMVGRSFTLADVGGASSPRPSGADDGLSSVRGEGGVVEIVGRSEGRSVVRFALTPPVVASTVQVLGDFSLWEPLDMEADGRGGWQVDVEVREGVHHFGFLVDDEWYVPDDAPDVVADEWGRRSATLVIEGAL